jgi:uncharacterized protein YdiU (UPF0061 family)
MLRRLGVQPRSEDEDALLVQSAFGALASGAERLRWEPFFFDWFGGQETRALGGPRAELYAEDGFAEFRQKLAPYEAERPERLAHPYFAQAEPEELLYDQIEALWAPITEADDWREFNAKLARIETARLAWGFTAPSPATPTAPAPPR